MVVLCNSIERIFLLELGLTTEALNDSRELCKQVVVATKSVLESDFFDQNSEM